MKKVISRSRSLNVQNGNLPVQNTNVFNRVNDSYILFLQPNMGCLFSFLQGIVKIANSVPILQWSLFGFKKRHKSVFGNKASIL